MTAISATHRWHDSSTSSIRSTRQRGRFLCLLSVQRDVQISLLQTPILWMLTDSHNTSYCYPSTNNTNKEDCRFQTVERELNQAILLYSQALQGRRPGGVHNIFPYLFSKDCVKLSAALVGSIYNAFNTSRTKPTRKPGEEHLYRMWVKQKKDIMLMLWASSGTRCLRWPFSYFFKAFGKKQHIRYLSGTLTHVHQMELSQDQHV